MRAWAILLPLCLLAGCSSSPPAAPYVDPVVSPTSLLQQDLTGWAKPGTTIDVAGGAAPASTTADPYIGRFRVTVMLTPTSTNTLNVTARNGDGTSKPTVVTIVTPAPPDRITLELSASTIKAGGSITARVTVYDTNGVIINLAIAPMVSAGPTGTGAVTVSGTGTTADPFTLTGTKAGVYTITASLSPDKSASDTLTVTAADAAMPPDLHVRLASMPAGADVTNATAGTALVYLYSVVDMYGNQIPNPNVTVSTNMLGAVIGPVDTQTTDASGNVIYQGSILNFVRSGTWAVSAHLVGSSLTSTKMIMVGTDVTGLVAHLTLSSNTTQINNPINYKVVVLDQFGNADTASLARLSLTFSPPPVMTPPTCAPLACATPAPSGTISFSEAGIVQVSASFSGTPMVVGDSLFVSVLNAPIPPTLTVFDPKATDVFAPGATLLVRIQSHMANAAGGTASFIATFPGGATRSGSAPIGQDTCPAGAPSCAPVFTVNVPGGAGFGIATIMIFVTDGSTSASITKSVSFTVDPALNIVANGRTTTVVARAGNLNAPNGLTLEESVGTFLYVANNGNNDVLKIDVGAAATLPVIPNAGDRFSTGLPRPPTDAKLRPLTGALGTYPPATFHGVYIGTDGNSPIRVTDTIGVSSTFGPNTTITNLIYDKGKGLLYATDNGAPGLRFLDPLTGVDASAMVTFGGGFALNAPWGVAFFVSGATPTVKVVISDDGNHTISMCDLGTTGAISASCTASVSIVASRAAGATLRNPRSVVIGPASGLVYVASNGNGRILAYNLASCAGGTCQESIIASGFNAPNGLALDAAGNLYVSDEGLNLIARIAPGAVPF